MPAKTFKLTQTPVQILDGTRAAYVQEVRGRLTRFTVSKTEPDPATTPYGQILNNDLSVGAGFPLWAWTPSAASIELVVLEEE